MPSGGCPLTPARIPPFELPTHGQRGPRNSRLRLQPSDPGPALLHVPTVTMAHSLRVLAHRSRVLSAEAPLWEILPDAWADGERRADPGLRPAQPSR